MFSIALLVAVLLLPARGHLRAEYVLAGSLAFSVAARRGVRSFSSVRRELVILGFLSISALLSIIAFNSGGGQFDYRDLFSILRYPVYGIVLAAAAISTYKGRRSKERLGGTIGLLCIAVIAISFLQYYDVAGLDSLLRTLYPTGEFGQPESGSLIATRITGTAGNPNWWGFSIVALFLLLTARILIRKKAIWIPVLFLLVTCLILTGSRTAVASAAIGGCLVVVLSSQRGLVGSGQLAVLIVVALLVIGWGIYFQLNLAADTGRFRIDNMQTLIARVDLWKATLQEYQGDIILGRGPDKSDRRPGFQDASSFAVRDNIYISYLAQYGIIGLAAFMGFCFVQIARLFALARTADPPDRWWPIGMLGVMAAWLLFGTAADTFIFEPASNRFLVLYGTALMVSEPRADERAR